MDSTVLDFPALPQILLEFSSKLLPTSVADVVTLTILASIAVGYLLRGTAWDRPDSHLHIYFERPQQQRDLGKLSKQITRNIAKKLDDTGKRLVIFWGSQSGTAERFANQLAKECQVRFGLDTMAADLSDYDPCSIACLPPTRLAVFILSTYGEGDPSDNANSFWEWITTPQDVSLANLQYTAFGLGNSNYKYYNRVVDVVVESLNKLGATSLLSVAKADDAKQTTEEDFLSWKENLFNMFKQHLHLKERPITYQPTIAIIEDESLDVIDLHHGEPAHSRDNSRAAAACSAIKALSIKSSKELFTSKERNCIHMELDLTAQPEMHYKTGDHLAVWPMNPEEEVEYLLAALGLLDQRDRPVHLKALDTTVKIKVPTPTTVNALFRYYLEICAPLSRDTILGLAQFAPTPDARTYVLKLGQEKTFYADFLRHTHLTFGRLLSLASPTAPWSQLPLAYVVDSLHKIQPRYYSISSSSVISPRRPSITALVSASPLPENPTQSIRGLTTNYLLALSNSQLSPLTYDLSGPSNSLQSTKLYAHIRKSKFKLPTLSSTPIIMVAAGSGLAPFRAFIAERAKIAAMGRPVGETVLFFGCRHPDEDFIYREEIEGMKRELSGGIGVMRIITAFSRVEGCPKVYVQDRVQEMGEEVVRLLDEGSSFYVCGRASMAREVGRRVTDAVCRVRGWGDDEARDWSEGLKKRGKWREDVWG